MVAEQSPAFSTADLHDAQPDNVAVVDLQFHCFGRHRLFHGPVETLRVFEDHGAVRDTVAEAGRGRVLVVDAGGSLRMGVLGDRIAERAVETGWAGLVVIGAIRDADALDQLEIGVRALGTTARRSSVEREGGATRRGAPDWRRPMPIGRLALCRPRRGLAEPADIDPAGSSIRKPLQDARCRVMTGAPRTLYAKIWDAHLVCPLSGGDCLLGVDLHLLTEVTSPQAFDGLRSAGRPVRHPGRTLAVADHNVPTDHRRNGIADPDSRLQVETLERNAREFSVPYIPLLSAQQGIVHVIGPELGLTLPGTVIVCGDSHTSTHGAFGALAFGIGTSEVEHVLATQTLVQQRAKTMLVRVTGSLGPATTAKDLVLAIIRAVGAAGATGHVIEYVGDAITSLGMAGRMTVCNMSIEAGARAGLIAPDETTFVYLRDRRLAPNGAEFDGAVASWRALCTDAGASYDREVIVDASCVAPMVSWGTSPDAAVQIDGEVPDPADELDDHSARRMQRALDYMGLRPGQKLTGLPIDAVFIGSCTNSRIDDLRAAAVVLRGRRVAAGIRALVVPGSGMVKAQAEAEGLDRIFQAAGFEWRDAGCSMCVGMNPDRLERAQRCASTSNRNFENRQGTGVRTHLMSPAMAAAAAVAGTLVDVRMLNVDMPA